FEDSKGFIWFATKDGLCKYDGSNFLVYRELLDQNSLSNGKILCIAEDGENNIWAGTEKGLNKLNPITDEITVFLKEEHPLLKSDHINDLFFHHETKLLWIATKSGVSIYDTSQHQFIPLDNQKTVFNHETRVIGLFSENEIYVGTHKGLHIIDSKGKYKKSLKLQSSTHTYIVFSVFRDSDRQVWVGTNKSILSRVDAATNTLVPAISEINLQGDDFQVTGITENNDELWLSTWRKGILFYDKKAKHLISYNQQYGLHP